MKKTSLISLSLLVLVGGCGFFDKKEEKVQVNASSPLTATAKVIGANNESYGNAYFQEEDNGVMMKEHGKLNPNGYPLGDLPNLEVGDDGNVDLNFLAEGLTLQKDQPNSLLDSDGSSIVIHESADDYKTDPAGNSGARIACGVIQ